MLKRRFNLLLQNGAVGEQINHVGMVVGSYELGDIKFIHASVSRVLCSMSSVRENVIEEINSNQPCAVKCYLFRLSKGIIKKHVILL
jgi:hypothetical protein